jgi:hypothetical protein
MVLAARTALSAFLVALVLAADAGAAVLAPVTIDGPASEIGELGGVAMAQDGSGGVVYRRAVDGRQHVFAARFSGGRWWPAQRVDTSLPFDSAWPRIGAANGGRLVVVWAQHTAAGEDSLYSAVRARGATRFQPPTVDFDVGAFTATYPSLAMNDTGNALVVYRAVSEFSGPGLPSGYVRGEVRLARFNGSRWQRLGVPANRNRAAPQETPSADNAPQVAIDATGNGVVAWHEPDDDFVSRVWARRIFGARFGIALAASPLLADGQLNRAAADRPALAETPLGRAVVAFRQLPDARNRTAPPQLLVNQLEESTVDGAGRFGGPQLVGDAGDATPAIDADRTDTVLGFSRGGHAQLGFAPKLPGPFAVLGQAPALALPAPAVAAGLAGRRVLASAGDGSGGEVIVRELDGTQVARSEPISASPGGPIRELQVAGSGNGDAMVAFAQGVDNDRQIAVSIVDAAPAPFMLTLPIGWTRQRRPEVSWEAADDALGEVVYTVSIDGRRIGRTRASSMLLREGTLDQGSHAVEVVATDREGQDTRADPGAYRLDRQQPIVAVTARGRTVVVTVRDPGGARASGIEADSSSVTAWGDGATSDAFTRRTTHRFRRAGAFTVTVSATDAARNRLVVRRTVRLR